MNATLSDSREAATAALAMGDDDIEGTLQLAEFELLADAHELLAEVEQGQAIEQLDAHVERLVADEEAAKAAAAADGDQPMAEADEMEVEAQFSPEPEGDDDNGAAAAPAQASVAAPRHSLLSDSYVSGSRVTSAAPAGAATHAARAASGPRPAPDLTRTSCCFRWAIGLNGSGRPGRSRRAWA